MQNILKGTRAYLSGPMDFVGSRVVEKYLGWRSIITPILKALGVFVLDPWNKPVIRGHKQYGQEGIESSKEEYGQDFWTNDNTRARFETDFWATVHIDLRMTDLADFVIAFAPTNIYSVGTVHEIVTARRQHKPVLLISPPVKYEFFPEIDALDETAKKALRFYGLKENPAGIPSQWYGNIVGGNNFFDGFGWEGLAFKEDRFYPDLLESVITEAQNSGIEDTLVQRVRDWLGDHSTLRRLKGGLLDHVTFPNTEEETLLKEALAESAEQKRRYFWYNRPYTPRRSVLFQLFSIASGYIPPRRHVRAEINTEGNVNYSPYTAADDDWLLINYAESGA